MFTMNMLPFIPLMLGGILGDSFGKLFEMIWDGLTWVIDQIKGFFTWIGGLIWDAVRWIGDLLNDLFSELFEIILLIFETIFAVIGGLLYFLFQVGVIAVKIFLLFFEIGKLIFSFFVGLGKTLASLTYTPTNGANHAYSEMIGRIFTALEPLQLNMIAYFLLFAIWIFTAINVIKMLSSIRVGGE